MPDAGRRPYARPELMRVDLVQDEVALATCKTLAPQTSAKGTVPGGCGMPGKNCKDNASS